MTTVDFPPGTTNCDPDCYRLAKHFMQDVMEDLANTESAIASLAIAIQTAIEDWITCDSASFRKSRPMRKTI